jgi:hypothetical protein
MLRNLAGELCGLSLAYAQLSHSHACSIQAMRTVNLSFELYNRLQEASLTFRSVTLILIFASRESYVVTLGNPDGAQLSPQ